MKAITIRLTEQQYQELDRIRGALAKLGDGASTIGQVYFRLNGTADLVVGVLPPGEGPAKAQQIVGEFAVQLD